MRLPEYPSVISDFQTASTELLGLVLDQSADCIKVIGPSGTLDFMNRNGRCAMEIDDFAAIAGKSWWELWPEESQPLIREAVERAQAGAASQFEAFCPTGKGTPRWWDVSVSPVLDEDGGLRALVSVSRDVTERVRAREIREAAAHEMRHRLQNAYTLAGAIIATSARGNADREEFAKDVLGKLERLGIAQSLLLDTGGMEGASVDQLVRRLTDPFLTDRYALVVEALPSDALDEQRIRALALVFGELSTNSNKHGAMGHGGSVRIGGEREGQSVVLRWSESLTQPIEKTEREGGNGFVLIRRTMNSLGGSFDIDWRADGLDVTIRVPLN